MTNTRPLLERVNRGLFLSGQTGSGKSRMTARLASYWSRVIYIDPMLQFRAEQYAPTLTEAQALLQQHFRADLMSIALQFSDEAEYATFFRSLAKVMKHARGLVPNFLLVVDEVDVWSSPKVIDPGLRNILRYGRHYGCSWIANCRADVDTNRAVRMNAEAMLIFRQGMLSPEVRERIRTAELQRSVQLRSPWNLTKHDTEGDAIENVHFLCVPDEFDTVLRDWKAVANAA